MADTELRRPARDMKLSKMTLGMLRKIVLAAFEEGYTQGASHPRELSVIAARERVALAFWTRIEEDLVEKTDAR